MEYFKGFIAGAAISMGFMAVKRLSMQDKWLVWRVDKDK